jgi:undecaprenyl-diphosphatase
VIDPFQAIALAIVQGLTEFLPISSSAHLVIPSMILGWPDQGLAFDVAVHVGTLAAVLVYYRHTLARLTLAWGASLAGGAVTEDSRTVWYLALATIPAGLVGLFGGDYIERELRSLPVIASTTLVFGVLLGLADRHATRTPGDQPLTLPVAMVIGVAQALAPIPGVSRSGVTITAALMLNMSRQDAARFSFLLSIPVITSAGLLKTWQLISERGAFDPLLMLLGAVVSGITAYTCIALFLRLLDRVGMMPFVYYRVVLAGLLYWIWLA